MSGHAGHHQNAQGEYPDVHGMCGLSNVSHGLRMRWLLNRTVVAMCDDGFGGVI